MLRPKTMLSLLINFKKYRHALNVVLLDGTGRSLYSKYGARRVSVPYTGALAKVPSCNVCGRGDTIANGLS